jgi:hypothetical protein
MKYDFKQLEFEVLWGAIVFTGCKLPAGGKYSTINVQRAILKEFYSSEHLKIEH